MFVILPSPHPKAPAHPSTPKVLRTKKCALTPYSFVIFTLDLHLSLPRSLGVRYNRSFSHTLLHSWEYEM
jgi:hypothetical protein